MLVVKVRPVVNRLVNEAYFEPLVGLQDLLVRQAILPVVLTLLNKELGLVFSYGLLFRVIPHGRLFLLPKFLNFLLSLVQRFLRSPNFLVPKVCLLFRISLHNRLFLPRNFFNFLLSHVQRVLLPLHLALDILSLLDDFFHL